MDEAGPILNAMIKGLNIYNIIYIIILYIFKISQEIYHWYNLCWAGQQEIYRHDLHTALLQLFNFSIYFKEYSTNLTPIMASSVFNIKQSFQLSVTKYLVNRDTWCIAQSTNKQFSTPTLPILPSNRYPTRSEIVKMHYKISYSIKTVTAIKYKFRYSPPTFINVRKQFIVQKVKKETQFTNIQMHIQSNVSHFSSYCF